jgi:hypothetical protein
MGFEILHSTGGKRMRYDLALTGMFATVPDIEHAWYARYERLVKMATVSSTKIFLNTS